MSEDDLKASRMGLSKGAHVIIGVVRLPLNGGSRPRVHKPLTCPGMAQGTITKHCLPDSAVTILQIGLALALFNLLSVF